MPPSPKVHDDDEALSNFWMAQANVMFDGAIDRINDTGDNDSLRSDGFRLVSSRKTNQQRLFKRRKTPACRELLSVGSLTGTSLDDIVYALHADSTLSHRRSLALRYHDRFLDGSVLHTMQPSPSSSSDAFHWSGVKYVKFKLDASELFEPRDATYFEHSRTTQNHLGQPVLFLARQTHSFADMPVVPEVVRMEFQEWFLFTLNAANDTIEYVHFYSGNPMGSYAASFLFNKHALKFHSDATLRLGHTSRQRYLLEHQAATRSNVQGILSITTCECTALLKPSRPRCNACIRPMCSNCEARIPSAQPRIYGRPVVHVVFCKHCLVKATGQPKLSSRPEKATPWSQSTSPCNRLDFDPALSGETEPSDVDDDVDTIVPIWQVGSQDTLWNATHDESTPILQGMEERMSSARSLDKVQASLEAQHNLLARMQWELSRRETRNSAS